MTTAEITVRLAQFREQYVNLVKSTFPQLPNDMVRAMADNEMTFVSSLSVPLAVDPQDMPPIEIGHPLSYEVTAMLP